MTMMTATQALSVNPATGQTLAAMPWANAQEIEHALSLAASGFKKWKMTSVAQRAQTLRDIGQALRAHAEEMAQCITREMGKPIKQAACGSDEIRRVMRLVCGTWPGNAES